MKKNRIRLVILTLIAFLIPPAVVITINYLNGISSLEQIYDLFQHWSLTVFTLPYYIGGPLIINSLLKKVEMHFKNNNTEEAQRLYSVISYVFLFMIMTYGLVSIPITSIMPGYSHQEVLYSAFVAVFYTLVSGSPLLIKFLEHLDIYYAEIEFDRKYMFRIQSKLRLTTLFSAIGGIGLLAVSFYVIIWRLINFPEYGITMDNVFERIIWIAIIALLLQILPNLFLGKLIVTGITKIEKFALIIGSKDLSKKLHLETRDEFGVIAIQLNELNNNLKSIISEVIKNSKEIDKSSSVMKELANNFATSSSDQAASSEEIAASVEEISANIMLSDERAQECRTINLESDGLVKDGQKMVEETMLSMQKISEQIEMLTDIAGQTNILAINASIEAANAGSHGKGFAIVAKEVRKLADKSKVASNIITDLIGNSLNNSVTSKEKMDGIVPIIHKTAHLSEEIAVSSAEQKTGTQQINTAVQGYTQSSQTMAQSSNQLADSAKNLAKKADFLLHLVSEFKV